MNYRATPPRRRTARMRPRSQPGKPSASLQRWLKRLVALVITVGALAGAVTAVKALWPSDPEDSVDVSVQVLPRVLLTDYQRRLASGGPQGFRRSMAQPTDSPVPTDSQPTDESMCTPEDGCEPTVEPSSGDESQDPQTTSATSPVPDQDEGFVGTRATQDVVDATTTAMDEIPPCQVRDARASCRKGLLPFIEIAFVDEDGTEVPSAVAAARVVDFLADTRMTEEQEPIGALVTASVVMTGLRGRTATLTWSMWPVGGGGGRLHAGWFDSHLTYRLRADTDRDTAAVDLWVPLPTTAGQYVIDVDVHVDGVRLANARSDQFE